SAAVTVTVSDGSGGTVDVEAGFQVNVTDGVVTVGCLPSEIPENVTATTNRADEVLVSWDAVASLNAQYRVFRSLENNVNTAVPLGDAWQDATSFSDITALAPRVVGGDACTPGTRQVVSYFYWVKSRSASACESGFSAVPAS